MHTLTKKFPALSLIILFYDNKVIVSWKKGQKDEEYALNFPEFTLKRDKGETEYTLACSSWKLKIMDQRGKSRFMHLMLDNTYVI